MWISTAASADSGIKLSTAGINATDNNNHRPCMIVDALVSAPDITLAEDRTITEVTGKPPIMPETMLPLPCASNSQFLSVERRRGSISSTAFTLSSDSRLATIASVAAVVHSAAVPICEKSGKVNRPTKPSKPCAIGTWTRCFASSAKLGASAANNALAVTPSSTTTSGPGNNFSGPCLGFNLSHANRNTIHAMPMIAAPGVTRSSSPNHKDDSVLPPSASMNFSLPSNSFS